MTRLATGCSEPRDGVSDQLIMVMRSNSWTSDVTSNREAAQIVELNGAVLVLKNNDRDGEERLRSFTRLK